MLEFRAPCLPGMYTPFILMIIILFSMCGKGKLKIQTSQGFTRQVLVYKNFSGGTIQINNDNLLIPFESNKKTNLGVYRGILVQRLFVSEAKPGVNL